MLCKVTPNCLDTLGPFIAGPEQNFFSTYFYDFILNSTGGDDAFKTFVRIRHGIGLFISVGCVVVRGGGALRHDQVAHPWGSELFQ